MIIPTISTTLSGGLSVIAIFNASTNFMNSTTSRPTSANPGLYARAKSESYPLVVWGRQRGETEGGAEGAGISRWVAKEWMGPARSALRPPL